MIPLRWQALAHLVGARFREFFREPEIIFWVYGFPLALALGIGLAFRNQAPEPPRVDVANTSDPARVPDVLERLNRDRPADSKDLVERRSVEECNQRLRIGKTSLYLVVHEKKVEYVYDPTVPDSAHARHWAEAMLSRPPVGEEPTFIVTEFNESGSRFIDWFLPGLVGANLMGGGLFGVGFVLVDMRVRKLFKRLMATPLRHSDLLLSLLVSRLLFLIPEMAVLLLAGYFWFAVPVYGSFITVLIIILVGATAFSGIGLLLASRTERTEAISGLINMIMMPQYIFCGVFFSSKRFPDEVQPLIQALPLTQINDALREVMLEGKSFLEVSWRLGILAAYAVVTFALALRWFKWR